MSVYKFNDKFEYLENNTKVIVANNKDGKWIKITRECFEIINEMIVAELDVEKELSMFEDDDAAYLIDLLKTLRYIGVLNLKDEKEEIDVRSITISLTKNCNLMCMHCSYNAKHNRDAEKDLSFAEIKSIIDKTIAVEPKQIIFTGGEPLIRKDIFEILEYAKSKFTGTLGIMTNSVLINRNNVERLTSLVKVYDISLDGYNQKTCDYIRGKGVYSSVIRSINLLQEYGIEEISLSMVIVEQTREHLKDFYELCKSLKVTPIPRIFSPIGRGKSNADKLEIKGDVGFESSMNMDARKKNRGNGLDICTCGAGIDELYIDYDGNIGPCPLFMSKEFKIGDINDIDLNDFFENKRYKETKSFDEFKKFLPKYRKKCESCNVNLFCWTCPHIIHVAYNDDEVFKRRCDYMKPLLTESIWGSIDG